MMMEKVRVQASLLAVAIIATAAFGTAFGANYTVGEPGGSWDLRTNLTAWASTITFHPGDQLVFKYNASAHDVVEVTQAGYLSCSAASPVSAALRTGNDTVRLDGGGVASSRRSSSSRYFICSTPGHCAAGMKLEVRISSSRTPSPPTGCRRRRRGQRITCSGSPPAVITTPGVVSNGAAARSSSAGLGTVVLVATVVMVSLLLGLPIA